MIEPDPSSETVLDLRGICCPHVVLRAKKALRDVPAGGILVLECTDPLAVLDVPNFVSRTGHALAGRKTQDGLYVFRIEKRASAAARPSVSARRR